jgi:hypothetical protein
MRLRRALFAATIVSTVVALLVGLAANSASAQDKWPGWLDLVRVHPWPALTVLSAFAAVLAATIASLEKPLEAKMSAVTDSLAKAVEKQWLREATWRRLHDPYPLPVKWRAANRELVVDWKAITTLASSGSGWSTSPPSAWASGPEGLAGGGSEIFSLLDKVPTRRLVVLGDPGAGKTILLVRLIIEMLGRRTKGEPVPILLPMSSWNPSTESLYNWLERRLITEYPALARPSPDGRRVTRAQWLLQHGNILPMLDGLDEIPDQVRGTAIARINDTIHPRQALIVASRTTAYRKAVHPPVGAEVQLTGAAGIELRRLESEEVARYLKDSSGGPRGAARWNRVFEFPSKRRSIVQQVLTTPLMAALARSIYNPRPSETYADIPQSPEELLNASSFPNAKAIERHLFRSFVRSAYRAPSGSSKFQRWTVDQAERWLTFLARDMELRQATTELAWWRLPGAAPPIIAGLSVGLVAMAAALLGYNFPIGIGFGLIWAVVVGWLVRSLLKKRRPASMSRGLAGGLLGGSFGALFGLLVMGVGDGHNRTGSFLTGGLAFAAAVAPQGYFTSGLAGAFAATFAGRMVENSVGHYAHGVVPRVVNAVGLGLTAFAAVRVGARTTPARGLAWSWFGFVCGAIGGFANGLIVSVSVGPSAGLIVGIAATIAGGLAGGILVAVPTDLTQTTDPQTLLTRDRRMFLTNGGVLGLALGLGTGLAMAVSPNALSGLPNGVRFGLGVGLANFVAVGLAFAFMQASWGSFGLARAWLATTGHLPWRLMTFLKDAHETHGVLRQLGAVYQFRHVEIQRELARSQE